MPTECSQDSFDFGTVGGRRIVGAFDGGLITSDAGALLLGATNKAIRLVERFASCFSDARDAEHIEHTVATLVGQACSAWRSATRISTTTISCATIPSWRFWLAS
jgi:hypothetical protein